MFVRSIRIKSFRCFDELKIDSFDQINLVAGKNDAGKTALLEAIFLHLGAHNPQIPLRLNLMRGFQIGLQPDAEETWGWLFPRREAKKPIEITSKDEAGIERALLVKLIAPDQTSVAMAQTGNSTEERPIESITTEPPQRRLELEYREGENEPLRTHAVIEKDRIEFRVSPKSPIPLSSFLSTRHRSGDEDIDRFSKLEEVGRQKEVIAILKLVDSRLERLAIHAARGVTTVRAEVGLGRLVPLAFLGEGVHRLFSLVLAILTCREGLVLIDEIENGFHHSILTRVWDALIDVAYRNQVQIIATTHSRECIAAANQAMSQRTDYILKVHRLERQKGQVRAVSYDREKIATSLEMDLEVR